jgi:hypothetical protein
MKSSQRKERIILVLRTLFFVIGIVYYPQPHPSPPPLCLEHEPKRGRDNNEGLSSLKEPPTFQYEAQFD